MTKEQKEKLITAVVTFITTVLSILFLQACTMSLRIVTGKQIGRAHV